MLAAAFPSLGIGFLGVSFAFGLTVVTMAYAVGHISGGHFNCAVTVGLWAGGRFKSAEVLPYVIAQVVASIVAAAVLYLIASGKPGWVPDGFAANGYGNLSPGKYGLISCFLLEAIATFFFLYVIIGTTSKGAAVGFAGIPIGLCLTLIHLFLIQRIRKPGAQHRASVVRRGCLYRATLALLGRTPSGRRDRRSGCALAARMGRRALTAPKAGKHSFESSARCGVRPDANQNECRD